LILASGLLAAPPGQKPGQGAFSPPTRLNVRARPHHVRWLALARSYEFTERLSRFTEPLMRERPKAPILLLLHIRGLGEPED
jgi:hypothetical protein